MWEVHKHGWPTTEWPQHECPTCATVAFTGILNQYPPPTEWGPGIHWQNGQELLDITKIVADWCSSDAPPVYIWVAQYFSWLDLQIKGDNSNTKLIEYNFIHPHAFLCIHSKARKWLVWIKLQGCSLAVWLKHLGHAWWYGVSIPNHLSFIKTNPCPSNASEWGWKNCILFLVAQQSSLWAWLT